MKKLLGALSVLIFMLLIIWAVMDLTNPYKSVSLSEPAELNSSPKEGAVLESTLSGNEKESSEIESISIAETGETAQTEQESTTEAGPVRLIFAGDILLSNHVINAYTKAGGIGGILDEGYLSKIRESHIFMANQEFPFSNRGIAAEDKQYTFRLSPSWIHVFQEMNLSLVTLANNHSLDFGQEALLDSFTALNQAGIRYVGAGENLERAKQLEVVEKEGLKIGYLAASRVYPEASWAAAMDRPGMLSGYDPKDLLAAVKEGENSCDFLVVYVHWGVEKAEKPVDHQVNLARQLIDAGADLVVGSHPHVLQGIEYYKGKPIVYSLGNFIFGSSIKKTALLQVDLISAKEITANGESKTIEPLLSLIPGTSSGGHTKMYTDETDIQDFYRYFEGLSFGITIDEKGQIHP